MHDKESDNELDTDEQKSLDSQAELENIGNELDGTDETTVQELQTVISPRTLSNLYWSLAKLRVSPRHAVYDLIETTMNNYIDFYK